jgi:hypothetical protein
MSKKFNPNLVKLHRSYTVEEIANLLRVHKNTVRAWLKEGLTAIDNKRPLLILGSVLRDFLQSRRNKYKKKCQAGEIYCVSCKSPQLPSADLIEYEAINDTTNRIIAICPKCGAVMNKFTNVLGFIQFQEHLGIKIPRVLKQLN